MSDPNTIARPEMAKLLGISKSTLTKVLLNPTVNPPKPLMLVGHSLVYDRVKTLAWIATEPLKNIVWQQRAKKAPTPVHVKQLNRDFLSGRIGSASGQHTPSAKSRQGLTQHVEIRGGAYDDGR